MLYFLNDISNTEKEWILKLIENVNSNDTKAIQSILNDNNIEFASLKRFEDDSFELIHDNDYLFLGPLGGVGETKGKYEQFHGLDCDFDEFEKTLSLDMKSIISGNIKVINLGK